MQREHEVEQRRRLVHVVHDDHALGCGGACPRGGRLPAADKHQDAALRMTAVLRIDRPHAPDRKFLRHRALRCPKRYLHLNGQDPRELECVRLGATERILERRNDVHQRAARQPGPRRGLAEQEWQRRELRGGPSRQHALVTRTRNALRVLRNLRVVRRQCCGARQAGLRGREIARIPIDQCARMQRLGAAG